MNGEIYEPSFNCELCLYILTFWKKKFRCSGTLTRKEHDPVSTFSLQILLIYLSVVIQETFNQ